MFEPFMLLDDKNCNNFDDYVTRVEKSAAWGGDLELNALANLYKTRIKVFSANNDPVLIGEEFAGRELIIIYHKYYFALGEHYNSVTTK